MVQSLQRLPNLRQISLSASEIQSLLNRGRFGILSKISSLTSIQCLGQFQERKIRNMLVEKRVPAGLSGIVSFIAIQDELDMRRVLDYFSDSEDDSQVPAEVDE